SQDNFKLGGSSFGQILNKIGKEVPTIKEEKFVVKAFNAVQKLIKKDLIVAGHDIGSGGLITTLLEMCFAENNLGAAYDLSVLEEKDSVKLLFNENAGIVFQAKDNSIEDILKEAEVEFFKIGKVISEDQLSIKNAEDHFDFSI